MPPARSILHLDMDAFYASVEQLDHPELRGKPVLVGYDGPRGVVAAASYESRVFGCHSAQAMAQAKRACPQAIVVPVRFARYAEISRQVFAILDDFSPVIEPLSIDEAFLDMTGSERLLGDGATVARRLKSRIREELGLTASVGVSVNKFLAKLASDLQKPDGLTVIGPGDIDRVLPPLPVTRLWGVGPATAKALADLGIKSIGDLRAVGPERLTRRLGPDAGHLFELAHGRDDRPVVPDREAKSIGHEQTFDVDVADPERLREVLLQQVEQVARRLRRHGLEAKTVSLKLRFGDFQTIGRSSTLPAPSALTDELWHAARELFDDWARRGFAPLRLLGMTASQFSSGANRQGELFVDQTREKAKRIDAAADQIAERFGKKAIHRGGTGGPGRQKEKKDGEDDPAKRYGYPEDG